MTSSNQYIYSFIHLFIFQVTPQFTHLIHNKLIKSSAKVNVSYNVENVMNRIKKKLTDSQKEMFSKTCFGAFLNITKCIPSL